MTDFHLMPSIEVWFDGEDYHANVDFQYGDDDKPFTLKSKTFSGLSGLITNAIRNKLKELGGK